MPRKYILILLLWCLFGSSCTVKLVPYLKPTNSKTVYNCTFVKPNNTVYRGMEKIYGAVSRGDTVFQKVVLLYDSINIGGKTAYYFIDSNDFKQKYPIVGSKHFLSSVMIFSKDSILLASIYKRSDLSTLGLKDFDQSIYPVKKKDTLRLKDKTLPKASKHLLLYDFRKTNVRVNGKKVKNCLYMSIGEKWPDTISFGKIWLHKKYGVVKWIRVTGRIEEIEL